MTIQINITVGFGTVSAAKAFADALTGDDNDVVLAMEKVARKRVNNEDIELWVPDASDILDAIKDEYERELSMWQRKVDALAESMAAKNQEYKEIETQFNLLLEQRPFGHSPSLKDRLTTFGNQGRST